MGVWLAMAVLLGTHLAVNAWWLDHDNHPLLADDAQHLQFARAYYDVVMRHEWSVPGRIKALTKVETGIYPPLFHLLSAAGALVLGGTKTAFIAINTAVFLCLIVSMYGLGRRFGDRWFAFLTALVTSLLPLLFGVSRLILTDLLSCLFVVWAFWALCRTDRFLNTRWVYAFAVAAGLGFYARWTTCLYFVAPAAAAVVAGVVEVIRKSENSDIRRQGLQVMARNVLVAALIAACVPAPWYVPRIPQMLKTYREYFQPMDGASPFERASVEEERKTIPPEANVRAASMVPLPHIVAGAQGEKTSATGGRRYHPFGPFTLHTWSCYSVLLTNKGAFLPAMLVACAGILVALARSRRDFNCFLVVMWLVGSYVILTLFWVVRSPAPRYVVQMLPAVGLLCVMALHALPGAWLRRGATVAFSAVLVFQYITVTFGGLGQGAALEIPVLSNHNYVRFYHDKGLVVWKDKIYASGALVGPPLEGDNWVDRVFAAMTEAELDRWYVGNHQANIRLVGINKQAVETEQRNHWPLEDGLDSRSRRVRMVQNPYVSVGVANARVTVHVPGEGEARFDNAVALEGLSVAFSEAEGKAPVLTVQYLDGETGVYRDFSPPVHYGKAGRRYHFCGFDLVRTTGIRLQCEADASGTTAAGENVLAEVQGYQYVPQPRPFVLTGHCDQFEELASGDLTQVDYVVKGLPLETKDRKSLAADFDEVAAFEDEVFGYWKTCPISVFVRRRERPICLGTVRGLRIETSGDRWPEGRWDLPWWRINHYTAMDTPEKLDYWSAPLPATVEARLGAVYDVTGIEIVPYSGAQGVSKAWVEYWDLDEGAWRGLSADRFRIDVPKHKPPPDEFLPKTFPEPWVVPIRTDRLRFTLVRGGTDPAEEGIGYVSQFLVYGDEASAR